MKKIYLLTSLIMAAFLSTQGYALTVNTDIDKTCSAYGVTAGTSCTGATVGDGRQVISNCQSHSGCKYVNCTNGCTCAEGGICPGGTTIDPTPITFGCKDGTIVWDNYVTSFSTVGTGKCTYGSTANTTIYRCLDGHYTSSLEKPLGTAPNEYTTTSPTCTACPRHPEDTITLKTAASYVTSGGAGFKSLSDCAIKANSGIKDTTGTFVYTSQCPYSV